MAAPTLVVQTVYAELLDRFATTPFGEAFAEAGRFISKLVKGRRYWYFQSTTETGRHQKYVGPETTQLLLRIAHLDWPLDQRTLYAGSSNGSPT